jgi:hypothetical protein
MLFKNILVHHLNTFLHPFCGTRNFKCEFLKTLNIQTVAMGNEGVKFCIHMKFSDRHSAPISKVGFSTFEMEEAVVCLQVSVHIY